jgi:threonine dehydrogenase-like Zn-dependent dehydrogenase
LVGSFTYSAQDFRDAAEWVSSGPAEIGELISRQVQLEEGPQAFADLARGDGTAGKVLVRMDDTAVGNS